MTMTATAPRRHRIGRAVAWVLVAYSLLLAVRAGLDPVAFAASFGVPVDASGAGFVLVYAVRSVFLSACTAALLLQGRLGAVSTLALSAAVLPAGDLLLVVDAGGAALTLVRHGLIAVVLVATGLLLRPERYSARPSRAT